MQRILKVLVVFAALAATAGGAGTAPAPCRDDEGCSLNGVCNARGVCHCDPGWRGSDCSLLALGKAAVTSCGRGCAYHGYDGNRTSSWGGSVLLGDDARYYMMAAEFTKGCPLTSWRTNSRIAAAVADHPAGPYTKSETAIGVWAHNPQWVHTQGKFLIFTLGDGTPVGGEQNCGGEDEDVRLDGIVSSSSGGRNMTFTIHYSSSVHGPWLSHEATIVNFPPLPNNMENWNPAPMVMPDGSIRIMFHTGELLLGEVVAHAEDWRGPYVCLTGAIFNNPFTGMAEDPFMWKDRRGNWHALFHKGIFFLDHWSGGHAFSRDGLTWSSISRSYNTTINMEDGSSWVASRRERPKLLFDSSGNMQYLFNGVQPPTGGSYTLVVPIDMGDSDAPIVV